MKERIERINKIVEYYGISKNSLAKASGLASSNMSKMMSGEQPISDKTLGKIVEAYPQISLQWLKTGEGDMLLKNPTMIQTGNGGNRQQGTAGHNLTQTNNSEKIVTEFIEGLKSQNEIAKKAMSQTDRALDEISEQRKLVDRLITILENK